MTNLPQKNLVPWSIILYLLSLSIIPLSRLSPWDNFGLLSALIAMLFSKPLLWNTKFFCTTYICFIILSFLQSRKREVRKYSKKLQANLTPCLGNMPEKLLNDLYLKINSDVVNKMDLWRTDKLNFILSEESWPKWLRKRSDVILT